MKFSFKPRYTDNWIYVVLKTLSVGIVDVSVKEVLGNEQELQVVQRSIL